MRKVTVALQGNKLPADYARLAALAERLGFDGVSTYSDLGFQPALGPLLAMAGATSRVTLGPSALNPSMIHPVEIAGQAAYLDQASGGRSYLGLARGAWLDRVGFDGSRPLTRLREAVEVIQHLLEGREGGYEGSIYQLPPGRILQYPVLRPRIPLLIGTWGPRLLEYAGEVADEVKVGGSANPDMVAVVRRHLAVGERRAGRPEGTVGICFGAVTVVDLDGEAARDEVRREAALYIPVVAPLDPTVDVPGEHLERMAALVAAGDSGAAAALVPDDLLDRFSFAGRPEQIAAQAEKLFAAGATRVEFGTPHGFHDEGGIELLASLLGEIRG